MTTFLKLVLIVGLVLALAVGLIWSLDISKGSKVTDLPMPTDAQVMVCSEDSDCEENQYCYKKKGQTDGGACITSY